MNLISTNMSVLRLFSSQFLKLVDRTYCRNAFFDVFPRYLELSMSEYRVLKLLEMLEEIQRILFLLTCQDCGSFQVIF